jgi:signal transduction histidine kinase
MAASGYLQILQKGMLKGEQLQEGIGIISRNVGQIVSLVNDILFLQEIELVLPEFQPVDMGEIIQRVSEKYKRAAEDRHVHLKTRGDHGLPQVSGDSKSLERAVTALVDNAIKFSPRGGDVELRLMRRGNQLVLAVEDHGIGIAPEIRPHIFDRFYHLEKSGDDLFGGLGLGLAITRQVIQQHRGALDLESTLGKGSTFTMSLPTLAR